MMSLYDEGGDPMIFLWVAAITHRKVNRCAQRRRPSFQVILASSYANRAF